jgi:hypothetical protein
MHGSAFAFPSDPSTHLFFDDQRINIRDVQTLARDNSLNLSSVWCLPFQIELHDETGQTTSFNCVSQKDEYIARKMRDPVAEKFKAFAEEFRSFSVGTGITREIIEKIIEKEEATKRTGLYFFDFDMLLSQFSGLNFPENLDSVSDKWLAQYAKYIFSDYIGVEPEGGRLNLLKRMFAAIGPERIYVITANPGAEENPKRPGRIIFIKLIQVLLPSFIPAHLVYAGSGKAVVIYNFVSKLAGGGARTRRTRRIKARRTKRKTKAKTRKTKANRRIRKKSRRLS